MTYVGLIKIEVKLQKHFIYKQYYYSNVYA